MSIRKHVPAKPRKAKTPQRTRRTRSSSSGQPCFCYIVECSDGTFYTGWAVDAQRRVKVHNAGRGARYTRARRPVRLVYIEPQPDRTTAMKRERAIKQLSRAGKQALISGPVPRVGRGSRRKV